MNLERTFTSALVIAALSFAVPAGAQERGGERHDRGGERATARAQGPRQGEARQRGARQNDGRQDDGQRAVPRGRDDSQRAERGPASRNDDRRGSGPVYRNDDRRGNGPVYRNDGRPGNGPRGSYRSYSARPYYLPRPYVRPHSYAPYRPFYFSRPYYSFRPRLSIGFGLWLGDPIPYPYAYLGSYRPRVYGYYPRDSYGVQPSVPIYGGVSFDIDPGDADLFVDGEYVGPIGNFTPRSEPLTLTPGVHRIAVQRDGFRPMEWEVSIEPGQVIPYRGDMDRY